MSRQATRILDEVIRRIKRSMAPGQCLEGMKLYENFEMRNEKHDDLPRVYIVDYSDKESIFSGGHGVNAIISQKQVITFQLVVDRKNGWLTPDSVTNVKKMGALHVKNLFIDEIERADHNDDDDADIDCTFGGVADKPPTWETRESGVFDLGLVMDVTMTFDTIRMVRASRASLVVTGP